MTAGLRPDKIASTSNPPATRGVHCARGYTLKYAQCQTLPDGSGQSVVMSDRPLGSWERTGPWKAATGATESDKPVTVIELHLNKAGVGQGKMSLSSAFAVDDKTKT